MLYCIDHQQYRYRAGKNKIVGTALLLDGPFGPFPALLFECTLTVSLKQLQQSA